MGNLTTDMTHLCREINALRNGRKAFRKNLENTVLRMRKDFSADLAGAHQAWFGPTLAGKMDESANNRGRENPGQVRKRPKPEPEERKRSNVPQLGRKNGLFPL